MEENLPKFENTDNLVINDYNSTNLRTAMCWAKFIAIFGFVSTGMMLVMSLLMLFGGMSCMDGMFGGMSVFTGFWFLACTVFCFFYSYFIYMFSTKIKKAIQENNQQLLDQGIVYMKNYFLFAGIMLIITLALILLSCLLSGMMFISLM